MADPQAERIKELQPSEEDFERARDVVHAEIMRVDGDREAFKSDWLAGLVVILTLHKKKLKAADARNEALLQALKLFVNLVEHADNWLHLTYRIDTDAARGSIGGGIITKMREAVKEAKALLDSGSASQEAKTPGGENA